MPPATRIASPNYFAGADQRYSPLELLNREQPQRVSHQYSDASVRTEAGNSRQSPVAERERRQTEIRLGLAAARREPEEIADAPIRMRWVYEATEIQEDE